MFPPVVSVNPGAEKDSNVNVWPGWIPGADMVDMAVEDPLTIAVCPAGTVSVDVLGAAWPVAHDVVVMTVLLLPENSTVLESFEHAASVAGVVVP